MPSSSSRGETGPQGHALCCPSGLCGVYYFQGAELEVSEGFGQRLNPLLVQINPFLTYFLLEMHWGSKNSSAAFSLRFISRLHSPVKTTPPWPLDASGVPGTVELTKGGREAGPDPSGEPRPWEIHSAPRSQAQPNAGGARPRRCRLDFLVSPADPQDGWEKGRDFPGEVMALGRGGTMEMMGDALRGLPDPAPSRVRGAVVSRDQNVRVGLLLVDLQGFL